MLGSKTRLEIQRIREESEAQAAIQTSYGENNCDTSANFHCLQTFEEDFDSVIHLKEALF